jgi:hypothetical protein
MNFNLSQGVMSDQQNPNHVVTACLTPHLVGILLTETNRYGQMIATRPTHCVEKHGQSGIRSRALEGSLAGINSLSVHQAAPRAWRLQCVKDSLRERSSHHVAP